MLKNRIIPCLDVKDGRVVKGVNFVDLVDAGDPVEQAKLYDAAGADELCFLDITASSDDRSIFYDVVTQVAEHCFMPLTVGGGVRTVDDVRNLLLAGADKVSINTAAIHRPELVREAADKFGSQCIVVAMDAKWNDYSTGVKPSSGEGASESLTSDLATDGSAACAAPEGEALERKLKPQFELYTHGGRKETGIEAVAWAQKMQAYGAGEILLTSMDSDGTKKGFNLPLTRAIADAVTIPVIASGGVGEPQHFVEGVRDGHATGLLAASIFHFGEYSVAEVKQHMAEQGVAVRV